MSSNLIHFRIRYGETDQMGYVYHGNYAQYFEMGRIEWLRSLGVSYKEMEDSGIIMPVINLNVNYLKPAIYDDLLTLRTTIISKPTARIIFAYKLYNEKKDLLTTATSTLVFVNKKTNRPMRAPKILLDKLKDITETGD